MLLNPRALADDDRAVRDIWGAQGPLFSIQHRLGDANGIALGYRYPGFHAASLAVEEPVRNTGMSEPRDRPAATFGVIEFKILNPELIVRCHRFDLDRQGHDLAPGGLTKYGARNAHRPELGELYQAGERPRAPTLTRRSLDGSNSGVPLRDAVAGSTYRAGSSRIEPWARRLDCRAGCSAPRRPP